MTILGMRATGRHLALLLKLCVKIYLSVLNDLQQQLRRKPMQRGKVGRSYPLQDRPRNLELGVIWDPSDVHLQERLSTKSLLQVLLAAVQTNV